MDRLLVESSVLHSVGYDAKKGDLEIWFQDGDRYLYLGVPAPVYLDLMNAESKGSFFQSKIKNEYVFRKIELSGQ